MREPVVLVSPRRLTSVALLVVGVLVVLSVRLYDLQVVRGPYYRELSEQNRVLRIPVSADRGLILDRNGTVLVRNVPAFAVSIVPVDVPRSQQVSLAERLGAVIGREGQEILEAVLAQRIRNPYEPVKVTKNPISRETALLLAERADRFVGIRVTPETIRFYETGPLYAALMGYTGPITREELETRAELGYLQADHIGRTGLERVYEKYLRGRYGWREIERDAAQRELRELAAVPPVRGNDLVLTIDDKLQRIAAEEIQKGMDDGRYTQGVVIAMHPKTGEILAMVTVPGYDNNMFIRGIKPEEMNALNSDDRRPLVNKAIGEIYPPGSTYKMVTGLAALSEGTATRRTVVNVTSSVLTVNGFNFFDWRAHGSVDFVNGFAYSSDIYFYTLGGGNPYTGQGGVGPEALTKYARALGFGEPSGIDLPGEEVGNLPDPEWKRKTLKEEWTLGNTYHASIGQGFVTVTPLQLLTAYAAVQNGGSLLRPHLLKEVRAPDGTAAVTVKPEVRRELPIAPDHLSAIREGARKVVTSGMAFMPNAKLPVAGKTGTAEFGQASGRDSAGRNLLGFHNWFVSWVPKGDETGTDSDIAMIVFTFNSSKGACASCISPAVTTSQAIYERYAGLR
ncbi:MAG TPA: penicillin-binding protein 2 [Candidatus Limnocylindria bacterium]|nr:penicillin-binding protein 2 [Candidatus Limnocylindria bacterium]